MKKPPTEKRAPQTKVPKGTKVPEVNDALRGLLRRQVRAVMFLFVRLVGVAVLLAVLLRQSPGLERYLTPLTGIGMLLIVWPFLSALGKIAAWRIRLGRAYVEAGEWQSAERTLRPLLGARAQLFDAAGEGAFYLAQALQASGQTDEAKRLWETIAATRRGVFAERARGLLP